MIGLIVAACAMGALLAVCCLAIHLDRHSRSELREVLWPKYRRTRLRSLSIVSGIEITLACLIVIGSMSDSPGIAVASQIAGAILGGYLLAGCGFVAWRSSALFERIAVETDPMDSAVLYAVSWPLWQRRYTTRGLFWA